jgi:DNA repair exonuclease SbcCD nuclease subunit
MKIYFLGDMHASTQYEWSKQAFESFIDWFRGLHIEPNSILIQLGDVFDRATNYGEIVNSVTHFFRIASRKFEKIYVLGGNHDLGFYKQKFQYATEYLNSSFNNINPIYKETILKFPNEHLKIAVLPFQKISGKILENYYSNELEDEFYSCDITCGHVSIKEEGSFFGGIDPSKFDTKFIMGHIHVRNGNFKKSYTGSIMPFRINEDKTELPRSIITYDTQLRQFGDVFIPNFIKFEYANFGDTLPNHLNSLFHLYIIKNCKHLQEAKNYYSKNFIYGIEKQKQTENSVTVSKSNILMTPEKALELMIKEKKVVMKRKTLQLVKELLSA